MESKQRNSSFKKDNNSVEITSPRRKRSTSNTQEHNYGTFQKEIPSKYGTFSPRSLYQKFW